MRDQQQIRPDRQLFIHTASIILLHAIFAVLNPLLHVLSNPTVRRVLGSSVDRMNILADVGLSFKYASQAFGGAVPYRDYPIEYPVLSFPVMFLPRLVAESYPAYTIAFAIELLLFDALTICLLSRTAKLRDGLDKVPECLGWYTLFLVALGPIVFTKLDLVPMTVVFAAALYWSSGRSVWGGLLTAVGTLVKLFPAVVWLAGLVWDAARPGRSRWRGTASFLLGVVLGVVAWQGFGGSGIRNFIEYHLYRGLEIESLYAGVQMIIGKLAGADMTWHFDHASFQLLTPWSGWAAALSLPALAVTLLVVTWRFYGSGTKRPMQFCAAVLLAFVITGKVLSPQYLIWLFPFVALVEGSTGRMARRIFLGCCLATTAVYPCSFTALLGFSPVAIGLLNVRNLLLLGLFLVLVIRIDRGERLTAADARGDL